MSEVKVRITAANETQTGFQSVLADAKKTSAQVKQTFAKSTGANAKGQEGKGGGGFDPIAKSTGANAKEQEGKGGGGFDPKKFYDDAIKKAEAQIEKNLAKRKQAREAAAQAERVANSDSETSIMSLVGRFALLAGVASSVGKVISLAFEQVSDAFKQAAETSKQLASALQQAGSATSSSASAAGFKQITALADQLERTRKETYGNNFGEALANAFQGRPGQLGARLADVALSPFGMSGSAELGAQADQARTNARSMLVGSLSRQANNAIELLDAGGDPQALRRIQREQQNREEIDVAKQTLDARGAGTEESLRAIELIKARQAATQSLEEQAQIRGAGSISASSFQRIGFASNEFFDTRKGKDAAEETARLAEVARQILRKIETAEPLVLGNNK